MVKAVTVLKRLSHTLRRAGKAAAALSAGRDLKRKLSCKGNTNASRKARWS